MTSLNQNRIPTKFIPLLLLALLLLLLLTVGAVEAGMGHTPAATVFSPTTTPRPSTSTPLSKPPTRTPTRAAIPPTRTPLSATQTAAKPLTLTPTTTAPKPKKVIVNGRTYDAYLPAATKPHQWYHFTCEFDAAWVVLQTYGFDVPLEKQVQIIGQDKTIEPYYKETKGGITIYGGNITNSYSGDYKTNFLARSTGNAMRKVFEYYGLKVTPVSTRAGIEAALLRGELIWIKTTVDFKGYRAATWVMPDGRTYKTVLGNDHAVVIMGFSSRGVVIRDVLGPTSTGRTRKYEYEVPWPAFLTAWAAQSNDGLAVALPKK